MDRPYLKFEQIGMSFRRGQMATEVLRDIDLTIAQGEFVSMIGHSGCGKSTLLNILGGLLKSTTGEVFLEGKVVDEPGPDRAIVFQNHSLLPWLTVYGNVAIAVDKVFGSRKSKAERHDWVMHNLELVQMAQAKDKRPHEISGGMKQRVGIARALAMQPKVLLMDEPFGALDALTRAHLQDSVMEIHAKLGNTVMMITHDVDEAVLLSDRVVMMTNGPSATIGDILKVDLARPRRDFDDGELAGMSLVIVAGDDEALQTRVSVAAQQRCVPVNVVDRPKLSSFIMPAIVDRTPITIAISTGGAAPALARRLRAEIERAMPAAIGRMARFAEIFREQVRRTLDQPRARRRFWDRVFSGRIGEMALAGDEIGARRELIRLLDSARHEAPTIGMVHLVGAGPGDPDLLTMKAHRLLQRADAVVYDRLVAPEVLAMARRDAERIHVGKRSGHHCVPQDEINE